jgi:hypothetical protein
VVNNLTVPGLVPYQSRVNYSARAVDSLATTLLDNVNVQFVGLRQPGTVSFGSATYTVLENQSVALIDVIRTGGTAGSISIGFVAADGTARHAVNYVAVSGTVTFAEGDSIQTIVVPIIDDQVFSSNKTVDLYLSNPTLTAPLGSPIRATLTIVNTDPDLPPPTVSRKVQPVYAPRTRRVVAFRLTFSRTMDSTSAQNTQNYEILIPPARKNGARRTVPISQAVLDPGGQIVTLVRADLGRMHLARQVQIRVNGKPPAGLKDTSGVFLAGMNGQAGTDAVLSVSV